MSIRTSWFPALSQSINNTVVVCDEDPLARARTCEILIAPGRTVQPFASAQELLDYVLPQAPACVILETRYESVHGLDLQRHLIARAPCPHIVFLTGCTDVATVVRAMHAGAIDYLTKPASRARLQRAAELALELDGCRRKDDQANGRVLQLLRTLTRREHQVMGLVTRGRLNKQIAHELMISEVTVKMHRGQVMRKMGVRSVAELVTMIDRVQGDWNPGETSKASMVVQPAYARYSGFASQ